MAAKITLIGAGPGDPDLLTLRGRRALERADVILYDALIDPAILEGVGAPCISVGKRCGRHAMSQEEINALLVRLARKGLDVVRLKGGDPTVLGRGAEEALAAVEAGVDFEIVPGVSSAVAVPALAGIPVTHRGVADSYVVLSAHRQKDQTGFSIPPFQPRTTVVILMGVTTVEEWTAQLASLGYPGRLPVAFVMSGARTAERVIETRLDEAVLAAKRGGLESPAVAIVGEVVGLRRQLMERPKAEAGSRAFASAPIVAAKGRGA